MAKYKKWKKSPWRHYDIRADLELVAAWHPDEAVGKSYQRCAPNGPYPHPAAVGAMLEEMWRRGLLLLTASSRADWVTLRVCVRPEEETIYVSVLSPERQTAIAALKAGGATEDQIQAAITKAPDYTVH